MKHHIHLTMWLIPGGILVHQAGLYSLIVFGLTLLMVAGLWYKKFRENRVQLIVPEIVTPEEQYLYMVTKVRKMRGEYIRNYYTIKVNRLWNVIRVITIMMVLSSCTQLFYKPVESGTMTAYITVLTPDTTMCRKERISFSQQPNTFGSAVQFSYRDSGDTITGRFYRADSYSYRGRSNGTNYLLTYPGYRERNLMFALQDSVRTIVVGFECYNQ